MLETMLLLPPHTPVNTSRGLKKSEDPEKAESSEIQSPKAETAGKKHTFGTAQNMVENPKTPKHQKPRACRVQKLNSRGRCTRVYAPQSHYAIQEMGRELQYTLPSCEARIALIFSNHRRVSM